MAQLDFINIIFNPVSSFPPHSHKLWEAVYYLEGNGTLSLNEYMLPFREGQLVLVPPNVVHSEKSKQNFRNIYFFFTADIPCSREFFLLNDTDNKDLLHLVEIMFRSYHLYETNWKCINNDILDAILRLVLYNENLQNPTIEKIKELLILNLSNPNFKLDEIYADIELSSLYARKYFQNATGYTPLQFLTLKRIEYAKSLLDVHDPSTLKIYTVARMVGFEDPYYFSRVFKKITGVYPTQWANKKNGHVQ